MGFFDSVSKFSAAGEIFGGGAAAESTVETAQDAAEVQRQSFDQAQENLQPFLDASLAQIPGLERGATDQGFISRLLDVRGSIPDMFGGVMNQRGQAGLEASRSAGIDLGPQALAEISQLPPDVQDAVVFDIEQELNRREQELFAPGTTTGTNLARLGAQSATGIGNILTQGLFEAQQARSAGAENLSALGGSISGFLTSRPPSQPRSDARGIFQKKQGFSGDINTQFGNQQFGVA